VAREGDVVNIRMGVALFFSLIWIAMLQPSLAEAASQGCLQYQVVAAHTNDAPSSWAIDLPGYDSRAAADGLVGRLAKKQFIATVVTDSDTAAYQVRMSRFSSRRDALDCRKLLLAATTIRAEHIRLVAPVQPVQNSQDQSPQLSDSEPDPLSAMQSEDAAGQNAPGMSLAEAIRFGLSHNVQYREQVSQLPVLDLDVEAASDPFAVRSTIASSSNQRVGSELGREYHINVNKKFALGTDVGVGLGTSRFGGQSLSEATFSINQPLLKGMGTLVNSIGIEEAEQNRLKQRNLIHAQQQQLILDIITAYERTVLQKQSMRIHEATIKHSKNMLDSANAKFKFGMVSRMDVFRAELQMLEAEEALASAQSAYAKSLDDLKLLLGASLSDDISLSDPIRYQPVTLEDDEALLKHALDSSQELANLKIEQEMRAKRIEVAKNNLLPQLDISFQVTKSGTAATFAKSTRLNDTRFGIGLSGSPQFSHGAEKARYRRELLAHDFALRKYQQAGQQIRSGVREKIRQIRQGEKRIQLRKRSMNAADKQKQYAQVRYQKGLVDNAAVVDAEKSLVSARIGYLQAVVDYNIAVNALYKETDQLQAHWQQQP